MVHGSAAGATAGAAAAGAVAAAVAVKDPRLLYSPAAFFSFTFQLFPAAGAAGPVSLPVCSFSSSTDEEQMSGKG